MPPSSGSRRYQLLALGIVGVAAVVSTWGSKGQPGESSAPARQVASTDRLPLRGVGAVQPRISPDGKQIVFSYHGSIWRIPAGGGTMRRLYSGPGHAAEPCWSPDGKRIACMVGRGWRAGRLILIDAGSGKELPLPKQTLARGKLYFSPDGRRIVGNLRGPKQIESLRAFDIKSGKLETLLRKLSFRQPWALAPDGKSIAFITTMDVFGEQAGNFGPKVDVWRLPLGEKEPKRIVRFPARIHDIAWSPKADALFVSSELGGAHNHIWRIDLEDPTRPTKITMGQADEDRPSLSHNGKLLYMDNREVVPALVVHDQATGARRTLTVRKLDFGNAVGRVRLKVRDADSKKPLVARVALKAEAGNFHAPPGSIWRLHRDIGHFYVHDQVEFKVPAGKYRLRVWHGPEYRSAGHDLIVKPGEMTEQVVRVKRWIDASARGWYSGDNHIHANYGYGEYYNTPRTMAEMCAGEGLNMCNFMVANSDGDGVFDREFFRGRPDVLSTDKTMLYWNEEYRSTIWGHLTLVNLKHIVEPVFAGFKDTTNPYDIPTMSSISELTRRQGGLVNYTHPSALITDLYRGAYTAKGLPIHAALGQIDTMDIMGSNDRASTLLYHKLLNCGIRFSPSAGTDCFLNRVRSYLPGAERVYVKIDGKVSYQKWIDGLRAGKSFVSNSPFLELSVAGKGLGEEIKVAGKTGKLAVHASATSPFPLEKVEVLYNGEPAVTIKPAKAGLTTEIKQTIEVRQSGWIALRASGPSHPDVEGPRVYAHTAPIYVVVGGKPAGSAEDARYFLAWIERLWNTVQERDRIPGKDHKARVKAEVDRARKFYEAIVRRSR